MAESRNSDGKLVCKNCKGTDFVKDISNANNDTVCNNCGYVQEDNPIVSEVTFGESSSGAAVVHGSFLAAGQAHSGSSGALESREQTLHNAKRKLRAVSYALQIPEYITEAAYQWYKLCLTYNFVQGRKSQNVISACLYVACRKEKTHHMLIDFSSRLQVSVYSIGSTFLKMCKQLHINDLPLVDPSLYIQSFATKLQLGEAKNVVINDAIKLAQRMSRDWMYEGRRPAGIAGACLLLACRMNNIRITHNEIVAVSHVGEDTLQNRLNEFKTTQSAQMSIKSFRENFDSNEHDKELPPSLKQNLKKIQKINKKINDYMITDSDVLKSDPLMVQVLNEQELSSNELTYYLKKLEKVRLDNVSRLKKTHGIGDEEVLGLSERQKRKLLKNKIKLKENEKTFKKGVTIVVDKSNNDIKEPSEEAVSDEDDQLFNIAADPYKPKNFHLLPTTESMLAGIPDDSNFVDLDDDDEVMGSILDEEESKQKERIWVGLHAEFLIEQEEKRLKKEADILTGNTNPERKKRARRKPGERVKKIEPEVPVMRDPVRDQFNLNNLNQYFQKPEQLVEGLDALGNLSVDGSIAAKIEPENAADSVKNMLQGNSTFSKKINYNAIDSLFK